jgi:hypothetical protein
VRHANRWSFRSRDFIVKLVGIRSRFAYIVIAGEHSMKFSSTEHAGLVFMIVIATFANP